MSSVDAIAEFKVQRLRIRCDDSSSLLAAQGDWLSDLWVNDLWLNDLWEITRQLANGADH